MHQEPKKRSVPLKVAMKFPLRRSKRGKSETVSNPMPPCKLELDSDSDEERGPKFLEKRALNIKENKAMVRTNENSCVFLSTLQSNFCFHQDEILKCALIKA